MRFTYGKLTAYYGGGAGVYKDKHAVLRAFQAMVEIEPAWVSQPDRSEKEARIEDHADSRPSTSEVTVRAHMNPEEIVRHWVESSGQRTAPGELPPRGETSPQSPIHPREIRWRGVGRCSLSRPALIVHSTRCNTPSIWRRLIPALHSTCCRHEYQTAGSELVVTEGINFVLIRARPATGTARARVDEVAHTVLNLLEEEKNPAEKRGPLYRFPEPRAENLIVSTNPQEHPAFTARWTDRIDALVRAGSVYLLCYKKRPATMGFRDDAQWFAEDFRENPVLTE